MTFCLFGATGDLTLSKLLPALWFLSETSQAQTVHIVAVSRRDIDTDAYIRLVLEFPHMPDQVKSRMADYELFLRKSVQYVKADIEDVAAYNALTDILKKEYKQQSRQSLTFFLALSPDHYQLFVRTAQQSDLGQFIKESKAAVMLEKPFGHSEASARALEHEVCNLMSDNDVYRVDHYLAKPAVIRLTSLAEEGLLLQLMQAVCPSVVRIRLFETQTIRDRGAYYDRYGVLGDVIQNHVLQIAAVFLGQIQASSPQAAQHERHQDARANFLNHLSLKKGNDSVHVGQYEGYRNEKNIRSDSNTATYAQITYEYRAPDQQCLIIAEAGKALYDSYVTVTLEDKENEKLVEFEIQPHEKVTFPKAASARIPQDILTALTRHIHPLANDADAYMTLFKDAAERNPARFVSFDEIIPAWQAIDAVREHIQGCVPESYPIGWQPK